MKRILQSLLSERRIAGGAAILALTQLIASACGFLRDQAFSVMFPLESDPLGVASVYIAAFRPSDLLFQIMVMSCLSVIVVPFLAGHLAHNRREEVNKILTSTMIVFGGVFGLVALLMCIFFRSLAPHLVQFTGESLELYVRFARVALFTNFLFVFGNALGQYLIAVQKYWIYGLTPIIWSMSTILGTYFLTPVIGVMGPIAGTVIGTLFYVSIRGIAVMKLGFVPSLHRESIFHHEIKSMGILIIPRMAALGALQLQILLLDRLGSGLGTSMVAINQFASNFESVIPGIVGISLAQSAFSSLSQAAAKSDHVRLRSQVKRAVVYNLSLAIPGAVALALLSSVAGWLMHLHGATLDLFVRSLLIYCIAVPFESTNHIVLRTFYALKNTAWPALSSIVSCFCAVSAGTLLVPSLGVQALAVAYVVGQMCQTFFLSGAFLRLQTASKSNQANAS